METSPTPRFDLNHKKVLIVRLSALGDVIRTIPAVLGLMKQFPQGSFYWLVENTSAGLLRSIPGLHLLEIDRKTMRSKNPIKSGRGLFADLRRIKSHDFDVSIDFHGVIKSGLYPFLARVPQRIGYEKGGSKEGHRWLIHHRFKMDSTRVSRYERNLSLARFIDFRVAPETPDFSLSEEQKTRVDREMADQPILLFPGTSAHGRNKRWPAKYWAWLFEKLIPHHRVTFVFGPADGDYRHDLTEFLGDRLTALAPLSLLELTRALSKARFLISCDTGPMHLASVLGVPLVALMGPSDPILNQPLTGRNRMILPNVPCAHCRNRSCTVLICQDATTPKRVLQTSLDFLHDLEPA